jgi:hypothetical protein
MIKPLNRQFCIFYAFSLICRIFFKNDISICFYWVYSLDKHLEEKLVKDFIFIEFNA